MRNQATVSVSSSSSQSPKVELFSSVIDFNRNRSNESTETAIDTMKMNSNKPSNEPFESLDLHRRPPARSSSSGSACGSYNGGGSSVYSAEGRCVPISPKKMPMTPPRDAGSPAGSYGSQGGYQYGASGSLPPSQQHSFLALPRSSRMSNTNNTNHPAAAAPPTFPFRPTQQPQQQHSSSSSSPYASCDLSSLFRSSPLPSSSSDDDNIYSIERCNAFDEGDDDDDDEGFCYSDDEEDSDCGMAEF